MPLFIIAIIFLIGLLVYVLVNFKLGNYDETPVRIRFPEKFTRRSSDVNFSVEDVEDENNTETTTTNIIQEEENEAQGF